MRNTSDKIRVAVLYGGRSAEHEISLRSATNVIQHLNPLLFDVVPIGIDKQGHWFLGQDIFSHSIEHNKVTQLEKDYPWFAPEWISNPPNGSHIEEIMINKSNGPHFDVVFPMVHGTLCEDGTLQGLLEIADLPYVGCGVLSSAINMDKDISKRLALHADIKVAPYLVIKQDQWFINSEFYAHQVAEKLGYPVFTKPANTGSSIGINKIKTPDKLDDAIKQAFQFDTKILVEKALNVIELEVAVLESVEVREAPLVSMVGEVRPTHEFYSYDAKYLDENGADLLIPAPVSHEIQIQAQEIAKKLFITLECEGMARIDLFLSKDTNELYFNEINTIPGFTQISMYPKLMDASGVSYSDLLTHLIRLAIKRHKNKNQLVRSYTD